MWNHDILDLLRIFALQMRELWRNSPFAGSNMKACVNWPNSIVWLTWLLEILDNMWILIICCPACDVRSHSKMTSPREGESCYPNVVTKSDIGGGGVHKIVTSPPKKSFYFSLAFGQRGSSWALVSIPVVVSFQALAWVRARRLNKA